MKTNSSFFNSLVIITLITTITLGILFVKCGNQKPGGTCTYEGLECPTALNQYLTDSMAIAQRDSAYVSLEANMDSVIDENTKLKTQLAGCELQNHSHIKHGK